MCGLTRDLIKSIADISIGSSAQLFSKLSIKLDTDIIFLVKLNKVGVCCQQDHGRANFAHILFAAAKYLSTEDRRKDGIDPMIENQFVGRNISLDSKGYILLYRIAIDILTMFQQEPAACS